MKNDIIKVVVIEPHKGTMHTGIANLMTDEDSNEVIRKMKELKNMVEVNEGIDPYMNLSFVSLPVIGDIRLLPSGAFDVKRWKVISQEELNLFSTLQDVEKK